MKYFLSVFALVFFLSCKPSLKEKADSLHQQIVTLDSHADTPLNLMDGTLDLSVWNDAKTSYTKYDYPRMTAGGLDAAFFAVFVGQGQRTEEGNSKAIDKAHRIFKALDNELSVHSGLAALALNPDDALVLKNEGKKAIYVGIENGYVIGNDLSLLEKYYNMGTRYITLVHTRNNDICDSSNDTIEHNGLSDFGYKVVEEMNRLGIMVDVSHASDSSFFDILKASKAPVIASHSCARAICDNPRNLSDEQLKALAKNGGVIQMCILSDYVKTPLPNPKRDSARAALRVKYNNFNNLSDAEQKEAFSDWRLIDETYKGTLANVSDVVDHIDHIVAVAGIDHVGIGTDFDGGGGLDACYDVSEMKNITIELLRRGYSDEAIEKIWSGNFLRVFRQVQALQS